MEVGEVAPAPVEGGGSLFPVCTSWNQIRVLRHCSKCLIPRGIAGSQLSQTRFYYVPRAGLELTYSLVWPQTHSNLSTSAFQLPQKALQEELHLTVSSPVPALNFCFLY